MQRSTTFVEPGLLQVFRFYAWLRIPAAGMFIAALLISPSVSERRLAPPTSPAYYAFIAGHTLLLLGVLYWPWLERKLGGWYFPSLLSLAALNLIIEQRLVFFQRVFIEASPFLVILLILAAWQYGWRGVLAFTLATAGVDGLFNLLAPIRNFVTAPPGGEPPRDVFIYAGIVSRSATFLVIGYVTSRLVQAQRQQQRQLAEANQKLVSHAAALEQLATTRERVRLSRDLHDTLAHTLSAQAVQIDAVLTVWQDIPQRAQRMLERMLADTRQGLDETRRALRDLRAAPLEETGLAQALRGMAEDFAQRHSLELALDLPESADDLPPEVEQTFYRVAQEALENTARHASARRLELALAAGATHARLRVADDGRGFDPGNAQEHGLGLQGMRERAELIGARLELSSRPGEGTQVTLAWEASA